ncbi:MAG: hypothetical protein CEN87_141 [Parcubacteria group bacterium Licking1014_1]|nr:MAG: hypothetical protein CEN87_141 [Parcubacteria group bacterium Licking1014_1]
MAKGKNKSSFKRELKRELKREFIKSLSEREMAGFAELLGKVRKTPKLVENTSRYLMSFDANTLFGFLHRELFGDWDFIVSGFRKVMENLDEAKRILSGISVDSICLVVVVPRIPIDLQVYNEETGSVFVTVHAWKRYYERFCRQTNTSDPELISVQLQRSFTMAKRDCLKKPYVALRIIRNRFTPANYLLDQSTNCRFVVGLHQGKPSLLTVEYPFCRLR